MKKRFKFYCLSFLCSILTLTALAQSNLEFLLEEGYTVAEMDNLIQNMPYKKHESWMKKKGYTFREEIPSKKLYYYKKNEVVSLYAYYDKEEITEIKFQSSPQKYYQVIQEFSKQKKYRAIKTSSKVNFSTTKIDHLWRYNGYIYYAIEDEAVIGVALDYPSNSAKRFNKSYLPTVVDVKGGSFQMGASSKTTDNLNTKDNKPEHTVNVKGFSIGKYEVSVSEYLYFCSSTNRVKPSVSASYQIRPIANVTWDDAVDYCEWLSIMTGKKYRLPYEAEWEFAARGGVKSKNFYYSGSDFFEKVTWDIYTNSSLDIRTVKELYPNELDIYNMSSNVGEWCMDWYDESYYKRVSDNYVRGTPMPQGPENGVYKVIRGKSERGKAKEYFGSTFRQYFSPSYKSSTIGFRVVLED